MVANFVFAHVRQVREADFTVCGCRCDGAQRPYLWARQAKTAQCGLVHRQHRIGFQRIDRGFDACPYGVGAGNRELLADDDAGEAGKARFPAAQRRVAELIMDGAHVHAAAG